MKILVLLLCAFIGVFSITACNLRPDVDNNIHTNSSSDDELSRNMVTYLEKKDMYNINEIKDAFMYASKQPERLSTCLLRDMEEIRKKLGTKEDIYITDELAYCQYDCNNGGCLYVVFWDKPEDYDYYPIELVCFSMKELCFNDFDSVQQHMSTLQDIEGIDPATSITYIDYGEEKYSTHLTRDGLVKISYVDANGTIVVDSIDVTHQNLASFILEENS